jgi:hypothetical protein
MNVVYIIDLKGWEAVAELYHKRFVEMWERFGLLHDGR